MQAWAILAKEVVKAEHPDYEVVSCFSCFDLAQWRKQSVEELVRHGRTKQYDPPLARLASTFGVAEVGLRQEFWDYGNGPWRPHRPALRGRGTPHPTLMWS